MYKIAVLGERESVMGFAALGLAVFPVESAEEAAEAFHRLTRQSDAYAIIYVTETYAAALAAAGGDIRITSCNPALYGAFLQFLAQTGVQIENGPDWAGLARDPAVPLRGGVQLCADAWPAFATDTAPLAAAVLLAAEGKSEIFDRLFPNRFACAAGFAAMGAEVTAKGRRLMIAGGSRLRGAAVTAPDLRGGAALLVAALGADGTTTLRDPGHIRRGYADLPGEIRRLGAEIG